ncbi:hypothetical protein GQ602_000460 [Ophiocordyceps camponoti-floridani]|uniref:Uncharacterized protein n=1 Tax=Ophiocordyceps camponoti-floridani TaxID=2030778 RepID=A0A8H4QCA9_9HYPO|nr:hypothetical protein GQ602_000460 [Ophiocordyceps camponoti-floridani]
MASSTEELPTTSHVLAAESIRSDPVDLRGASQTEHHEVEVKDLGWNETSDRHVPRQVLGGIDNHHLWTLMRRFDKFVFRVRSIGDEPATRLDMDVADDDDFSPEKLRATVERLYVSVLVPIVSGWKHVARLRSWRERRRTSIFLAVYTAAWLTDLLIPTMTVSTMMLILYPASRAVCFPPVPPALVDGRTGGVQKPAAGIMASRDSLTGAPEKQKGEGVEREAHNLVNTLSTVAISASAGRRPRGDPHDDEAPDPTNMADSKAAMHDQTREPVSRAVWSKARPAMQLMGSSVDTWERFGNALSPTRPFPRLRPRLVLASCLTPLLVIWWLVTPYMLLKGLGFIIGLCLFGDPVIMAVVDKADRTYPTWQRYVQLRNTILKGVPTNAQLTITLLRIGERNKAPLPPPPKTRGPPRAEPDAEAEEQLDNMEATDQEKKTAMERQHMSSEEEDDDDDDDLNDSNRHRGTQTRRLFALVKKTARSSVSAALTADRAKAAAGAHRARDRLGVVRPSPVPEVGTVAGPVRFPARYDGRRGHAYVTTTATAPALSWRPSGG